MSEIDFVPNFIYKSTCGVISNNKSVILQHDSLSYISYDKSLNIWDFKTSTLIKSIRHKKYLISIFKIYENFIFIGFSSGLIQVYKIDNQFEMYLEYRIHSKKIIGLIFTDNFIISASSDGIIFKYDFGLETSNRIAQTNPIDVFDYKDGVIGVATGDCTFTIINEDKEHAVILNNRLKFISLLDEKNFIIIFRDNNIKIYDALNDKYKDCIKLKKIKSVKRIKDILYILSDKKLYRFNIKFEKGIYSLIELQNIETRSNFVDFSVFNTEPSFITKDNSYIKDKLEIGYHKQNITDIKKDKNGRISSMSKDKLIIWNISDDKLIFYNQIELSDGISFTVYHDYYVIGEKNRIIFVNIHDLKIYKTVNIEEIGNTNICIAVSEFSKDFKNNRDDFLGIAVNQKIDFYNQSLEIIDSMNLQDYVSSLKIFNGFYFIGLLNSKVYIYDGNKDLYKTLYGHSLPVININVNDKLVYTIGADKMLKIWGLDFGDCRKSIIINESSNIQLISDNLFIVGSTVLKYYHVFKVYYEKKYFNCNLLLLDDEFLVGSNETSIRYFHIDKYELEKIDEVSEDSEIMESNAFGITNLSKYEEFLNILDETDIKNESVHLKFNRLVREIGFGDFDSFIILLTATQIYSLIDLLFFCDNTVVASRIFCNLISVHKEIIIGNKRCNELRIELMTKMKNIRDKLGKNTYKLILRTGIQF